MPRTEQVAPLFGRAGLNLVVSLYQKGAILIYNKYTSEINNKDTFFRVATEADFSPASAVNQANGIDYQDYATPYYMDKTPLKRGIGFAVATEVAESDKYGIIAKRGRKMARAIDKSMEADVANFVNLGTNVVNATPDGVALFSASHLLESGTASNILTGNPSLSVASLAQALQEIMRQPSHTGDPMMELGPFNLVVPPELADLANRLVKTQKYPTTNDNDINWAGTMVTGVIVNPYFTSTTAWMLVPVDEESNPLKIVNRRGLTTKESYDQDKDVDKFTATKIWVKFAQDWRNIIFSAGA